jgi:hypothetical protein
MHSAPTIISPHRAARFSGWLMLWLVWFAGVCARWLGGAADARDLDRPARAVSLVVFLHVCARMRAPAATGRHRHGRALSTSLRRLIGARLRRAVGGRDIARRFLAILAVMRDLEAHVAALARRLRRGLTRLRVIVPARSAAPRDAPAPAYAIAGPDTS